MPKASHPLSCSFGKVWVYFLVFFLDMVGCEIDDIINERGTCERFLHMSHALVSTSEPQENTIVSGENQPGIKARHCGKRKHLRGY